MITEEEIQNINKSVRFYIVIPRCDKCCRDEEGYDNSLRLGPDMRRLYTKAGLAIDPHIFDGIATAGLEVHLNAILANLLADPVKYMMLLNNYRDDTYDSVVTELIEFVTKLGKYKTSTIKVEA